MIGNYDRLHTLSHRLFVDLGYRYFRTSEISIDHINVELASSKIMLGMRYAF